MTTLTCLTESDLPVPTRLSLRRACTTHGITYDELDVDMVDPLAQPLPPGDLLFSPATSAAASEAEIRLWQPGVGTIYRNPLGPLQHVIAQETALTRAGLPVPMSVRARTADRDLLRRCARALGGFPIIVRIDGGEGGERVSRADTMAGLVSLVGLLLSVGRVPQLVAYVPDALHLRVVVVGGRAVAGYDNPLIEGDFRSAPSDDPADYRSDFSMVPPDNAAELAVAACDVLSVDFGGVDVLRHSSGRLYLLEVNTPCYFPQAERFGADVSGPLIDALLASAAS